MVSKFKSSLLVFFCTIVDMASVDMNCPPGLESLLNTNKFYVLRNLETIAGIMRPWDSKKSYRIIDGTGQPIYNAIENSDNTAVCCLGNLRPWEFTFVDRGMHQVFTVSRNFKCWLQEIEVHASGCEIGFVTQNFSLIRPSFNIRDHKRNTVLKLDGPCAWGCDIMDIDFKITSADGVHDVGVLTKQWTGISRELFNSGNTFSITFPLDLDVKMKAVLVGASILIDFMRWTRYQ